MHQLFVYGTLRKGGVSHHLFKGAKVVQEEVWLEGFSLYSAGWYPLAVRDPPGRIIGDIIAIPEAMWHELDAYEGDGYERIYLEEEQLWIYLFRGDPEDFPKVAGGDWLSKK